MTELFNKDKIRACSIPFDENVYSKYLEGIVNCQISINGYNKKMLYAEPPIEGSTNGRYGNPSVPIIPNRANKI